MSSALQFFYDVASPYSYLSFMRIGDVAKAHNVSVIYRPFLLGGVFRATNNQMPAAVPARATYLLKDLARCAGRWNIPFNFSSSFPHNSLHAMRAITAAKDADLVQVSRLVFEAAWYHDLNIADLEVLASVLGDHRELLEDGQNPAVKEKLKATTADAVSLGCFGAPYFVVGEDGYWGNDRLEMAVEQMISL